MKVICIGRNYVEHAKELNNDVPDKPMIFMKPASAILVNNKPFYYPDFSSNIHYEAELVIKICKNGRHVDPAFAHRYYDEVTIGLDLTARDIQQELKSKGHPWEIAKGFDGSAVLGRFVEKPGNGEDGISFHLEKNGETVQNGDTRNMIFSINDIIVYASKFFRLQMGDIIFTGTPAGVGPIAIGDRFQGYVEGQSLLKCNIR